MAIKKRGLGRGLDALLGAGSGTSSVAESGEELVDMDVGQLQPGKHQPRRNFDADALDSLASSIKAQGVVQPIVVRPIEGGRYEIVAGERRWRAAQKVGLKTIPAVVRNMEDRAAMAVALVENIQRADLNPLEEADALRRLISEVGLTHELCAEAVGRSRAAVTNLLRLFELNEDVQSLLRANRLFSVGHAKVLLGIAGPRQSSMANLVVARQLSVRQTEELVRQALAGRSNGKARKGGRSPLESDLSTKLGMPVRVQAGGDGGGRLTIRYRQKSELDKLLRLLR